MKDSKEHKRTEATHIKSENAELKTTKNKLRHGINKEGRKEKRIAHEDGRMMDDLATRSVECS